MPVKIAVLGQYLTTARALSAGQIINSDDITLVTGDLGQLPSGALHGLDEAIGKTVRNSIGAGQALRQNQLLAPLVVQQGQQVIVRFVGDGFSASAEGQALNKAATGEVVRVRMPGGRTLSGTAREDGTIELNN